MCTDQKKTWLFLFVGRSYFLLSKTLSSSFFSSIASRSFDLPSTFCTLFLSFDRPRSPKRRSLFFHRRRSFSFLPRSLFIEFFSYFFLYLESPPAKRRISLDRACETDTDGQRQRRKIYRVVRARYISSPAKSIPESLGIKSYHYCTVQYFFDMSLRILCDSLSSSSIPEAKF